MNEDRVVPPIGARVGPIARVYWADSPVYAQRFTERLVQAIERLSFMPRSGRMVREAGYQDNVREIIFESYRIIYRIRSEELLQIITVVRGARNLSNLNDIPP